MELTRLVIKLFICLLGPGLSYVTRKSMKKIEQNSENVM